MYVDFMLGRQLSDGGWAIGSEEADPDVTAMVLQALAPYQESTPVKNAVALGVTRLSALQNDDGGYTSWGYESSESWRADRAHALRAGDPDGRQPLCEKRQERS